MEYTVQKLAKLAGVSARTLRFYDEIGLLAPARISASGYRIYGPAQVDTLQQILFYRAMGMELGQIAQTLKSPTFDRMEALREHLKALEGKKAQVQQMIDTVQTTIEKEMGMRTMTDSEKFKGFKEKLIADNEEKYGVEIRERYGEDTVKKSNARMMKLTEEQYGKMEALGNEIMEKLKATVEGGLSPDSAEGREIAMLHKQWLGFTWGQYSPEAHKGLGDMYVADERFAAYYDKAAAGSAQFLRDAIHHWAE